VLLENFQRRLALSPAFVVLGIDQSAFDAGIADDDRIIPQPERDLGESEGRAVEQKGVVGLSVGDDELIHDAAIDADIFVFDLFAQDGEIGARDPQVEQIIHHDRDQQFDRSARGQSRTVREIAEYGDVKAVVDLHSPEEEFADDAFGVVGPIVVGIEFEVV